MEDVKLIKDLILSLAAIVTSSIAVYGVFKWKKELEAKAHFEAAKNLLSAVYSVRNSFEVVRSGWIDSSEFPEGYIENKLDKKDPKIEMEGMWFVYENRLKPLTEAMNNLDVALLEGEVLWGGEIKEQGRKLNSSYNRLVRSIKDYIGAEYRNRTIDMDEDTRSFRKDVSSSIDSEDELSRQIESSVAFFENLLRSYLGR